MKQAFATAALLSLCICAQAQDIESSDNHQNKVEFIDSTVVTAFRAGERTPVAHSEVGREELHSASNISSLPMTLSFQPSVVATNEGGTGLGYSKMRVRGSDATRINVTVNGITLNDAESQEVFWVNIPALSSMLSSVQLQRGVGTSVNGPGAFGASINMQTKLPEPKPFARVELAGGSYATGTVTAATGSGRRPGGLSIEAVYSYNRTEGYIDNAWGRLHSFYGTADWMRNNNSLKFNYILGHQNTGITWLGCPPEMLAADRRYNPAHPGDCDFFTQQHFQGVYIHQFGPLLNLTATLNYTPGAGYYETYSEDNGNQLRQATQSGYYAASTNLKWGGAGAMMIANASYSVYDGHQSGYELSPDRTVKGTDLYSNDALKKDFSTFVRGEWSPAASVHLYCDLQYRHIDYTLRGPDSDLVLLDKDMHYDFFNPKAGASFDAGYGNSLYCSLAVGHKEPARSDIQGAIKAGRGDEIRQETMYDWEFGWRISKNLWSASVNAYMMEYRGQLLETGLLSDDGYTIKENVDRSHRRGVELCVAAKPCRWLKIDGNLALSSNKIIGYHTYVDLYDSPETWNFLGQKEERYDRTDMLLSPSAVGMAAATFTPIPKVECRLSWKYVGKQYWDNTACDARSLPAYDVFSLQGHYSLNDKIKFSIFVDNLLGRLYEADAWVYRACFADGTEYVSAGLFPQAPCNVTARAVFTF